MPDPVIHSTAILDEGLGPIVLGESCKIGPYVVLVGPLHILDNVKIGAHSVIGSEPEHRRAEALLEPVVIGSHTTIREHVVVNRGIVGDVQTSIGSGCYLMHGCHVGHNSVLENDVTLAPFVVLAGHSTIMVGATLGIGVGTHQHSTVGSYAMVGMGVQVQRDVNPGLTMAAIPARWLGRNNLGMRRNQVTQEQLYSESQRFSKASKRPKVVEEGDPQ